MNILDIVSARKKQFANVVAALLLCAGASAQAMPNLVTDGSFEVFTRCYNCWNGSDGHSDDWGARMLTNNGALDPSWTTFGYTQKYWDGGFQYNINAGLANGGWHDFFGFYRHLHGGVTASPDKGSFVAATADAHLVRQKISGLTVGQTYAVSFYSAAATTDVYDGTDRFRTANATMFADVTFAPTGATNPVHGVGASHVVSRTIWSPWILNTLYFTATGAIQDLKFDVGFIAREEGVPPYTLLIDGVNVAPVPEPSQMALFLGGVGLLVALRLRTRRQR